MRILVHRNYRAAELTRISAVPARFARRPATFL